jgi:catechol 2,3-dioxygenase-like lactoylglutathione lyase family enzyme
MDWTLEVVVLPVSDIDRAIEFYRDKVGFQLDHNTQNEHMHVVQLTPTGSGCSIVFGDLPAQRAMEPGSMKSLQLCVADARAARQELLDRGVGKRDHGLRRARRRHLLRLRRPRRQCLGRARTARARREAADPR